MKIFFFLFLSFFQWKVWATGIYRVQGIFTSTQGSHIATGVGTFFTSGQDIYLITAGHVGATKSLNLIFNRQVIPLRVLKQVRDAEHDLSVSLIDAEQLRAMSLQTRFQLASINGQLQIAYLGRERDLSHGGFTLHALGNIDAFLVPSPDELSSSVVVVPRGTQSIEGFRGFQEAVGALFCASPIHLYISSEIKACLRIVEGVSGAPMILRGAFDIPNRIVGIMKQYDRVHFRSYAADLEAMTRVLRLIQQSPTDRDVGNWRFEVQNGSLVRVLSVAKISEFSLTSGASLRGNSGNAGSRGDGGAGGSRGDGSLARGFARHQNWISYLLNQRPVSSIDLVTNGSCSSRQAQTVVRFSPDLDARRTAMRLKELAQGQIQVCERTHALNLPKLIFERALLRNGPLPTQGDVQVRAQANESSFVAYAGPIPYPASVAHQPAIEIHSQGGGRIFMRIRILPGGVQDDLQLEFDSRTFQPVMEVTARNGKAYLIDFRQLFFDQYEIYAGQVDPLLGISTPGGRVPLRIDYKQSPMRLLISERDAARILYAPVYLIQ